MKKEEFLQSGLLEQYALGLTDPEENQIVEAYLESFPELRSELAYMHNALDEYAASQVIPPPKRAKRSMASGIHSSQNGKITRSSPRSSTSLRPWTLVAMIALLGLSSWLYQQWQHTEHQRMSSAAQLAALKESCDKAQQQSNAPLAMLAFLQQPTTRPILLEGTAIAPAHFALAYWNPKQQEVWIDPTHLPPLTSDRQYQIWADIDGEMISIGLLPPGTRSAISLTYMEEAESINITQEPLGGSEHPTVSLLTVAGQV